MTALKEAALAYAERGWPIFAVRADKTPYTSNGVKDATTNIKQIEEWYERWPRANIALDVGALDMMVIDLDPGHDMKELEENVGTLPATGLRARTPRDGSHLYYAIGHDELVAASASKLAPHVDVRSFHSYVLLPPSKTADGSYVWEEEGKPAYRTDEMLRVCNSARAKHQDRDNWSIDPDLTENVALATDWLKTTAEIAVEGQGGDGMAYATAAHMKSFGMSEEMAFDLMWEHWNPRCSPPWTGDEIDHFTQKIENGYSYNTSPPGNITPAYRVATQVALFKPIAIDLPRGQEFQAGRFRFVDREGMENIKPPAWLIDDFLPEKAYAILFGAPETFKTFVALDIALTIATGYTLDTTMCWPDVKAAGPVLFAAGEGRSSLSNRVRAWEQAHYNSSKATNFILADPVPLVSEELQPFVEGALALSPSGYKLVVLDTVGRAMQGVNENAQEHASAFTNLVERLQYAFGATVLALHHVGKDVDRGARGSSVFGADADTMIKAERKKGSMSAVALRMEKQKDAAKWPTPVNVALRVVHLTDEIESLVATKPELHEILETSDETEETAVVKGKKAALLDMLEQDGLHILSQNKTQKYSASAFGTLLAQSQRVTITGQSVTRNHLVSLRLQSARRIARCWDSDKQQWQWHD
jgi:hypothetical protein